MAEKDEGGEKLDKVLAHLESLHTKHDALAGTCDALGKRMDAIEEHVHGKAKADADEKERADAKRKADAEEKQRADAKMKADADAEAKAKADAEEKERADGAKAKADAEEKERADAKAKADAAARGDTALAARLAEIEKRLPTQIPEDQRQRFVDEQVQWERVAHAFGDSAGAPRPLNGETFVEYSRRLTAPYKKHSKDWKDTDLSTLQEQALGIAGRQIRADALQAAAHPSDVPAGVLREIRQRDQAGREIIRFVGSDDAAAWVGFTFGDKKVRINTKVGQSH